MNEYHVSVTATHHVFADLIVTASNEDDAIARARLEASAGGVEWSEGDLDVEDVWIDNGADFHATQTIGQEEEQP